MLRSENGELKENFGTNGGFQAYIFEDDEKARSRQ